MKKITKGLILSMILTLMIGMTAQAANVNTLTIAAPTNEASYAVKKAPTKIKATTSDGLSIKANQTLSVSRGKSITIKPEVLPANASSKSVTYKSSNTSVAKVTSKGKVTAGKKNGVATITVTSKANKKVTFKFKVKSVTGKVTSVKTNKSSVALVLGGKKAEKSATIKATVKTSGKSPNKTLVWSSANSKIAKVSQKGVITAVAPGSTKITVSTTDGTKIKKTIKVSVKQMPTKITATTSDGLSIKANQTLSVLRGKSITIKPVVLPADASSKSVTYKSSNTSVAKVTSKGKVTAGKKSGVATITVTSKANKKVTFKFKVKSVTGKVTSVKTNKSSVALSIGGKTAVKSATIKATVKTSGKGANKTLAWSSANSKIAKVSQKGVITAVAPGSTKITVTSTDGTKLKKTITVKVSQNVTKLEVDKTKVDLATEATNGHKKSVTIKATVTPKNATNKKLKWSSDKKAVATVSSKGVITAVAPGSAKITVSSTDGTNLKKTITVTVIQQVTSLSVEQEKVTLATDSRYGSPTSVALKAKVAPENATLKDLTYKSSNNDVAKVDAKGNITAVAPGIANITVTTKDGTNISKNVEVTVLYGKHLTANLDAFANGVTVGGGDKSVTFADSKRALAAINAMTEANDNESILPAKLLEGIEFTYNEKQYTFIYSKENGYSLKDENGTDITLQAFEGKVVGDFEISKGISAEEFEKYLAKVQWAIAKGALAGSYEFGDVTVNVDANTFEITDLTVTEGVITATVDGEAVTARLFQKELFVTSTGSLDEAVDVMETILLGSFTVTD